MNAILKFDICAATKGKLLNTFSSILSKNPYLVFIKLERIYIVNYFMVPYKKFDRGQWNTDTDIFDRDKNKFEPSTWSSAIGTTLHDTDIKCVYFCNVEGLTKILKEMGVQSEWIIYKLMKGGVP